MVSFLKKRIANGGGKSLTFQVGETFSVKPRIGMLNKNESRLVVFCFSPSEQKTYEQTITCYFNSSSSNAYNLHMRGLGFLPNLEFENQNMIFFKPTCVGTFACRSLVARNTSRIPIKFEACKIKKNGEELKKNLDAENSGIYSKRTSLTVIGTGTKAHIVADTKILDFGAVLVNTFVEKDITIFNPSDCDVFYDLEIFCIQKRSAVTGYLDGENLLNDCSLEQPNFEEIKVSNNLRESEFEILDTRDLFPARSNQILKIRACVRRQAEHEYRIYYRMKNQSKSADGMTSKLINSTESHKSEEFYHLFDIKATGVYPIVNVVDIRSDGHAKALLWHYFSLQQFNSILETVSDEKSFFSAAMPELEEDFDFPTDQVTGGDYKEPPSLDFNFGASPINSPPVVVNFSLMNPGVVPVEWVFYFPNDLEVEIENWADPGNYTEEQIHTNLILENNLFNISPKTGILHPGESVHIVMTYWHKFSGFHKLPVIFKLKNGISRTGKEIVPVSIGTHTPPIQKLRLSNQGLVNLSYVIDLAPLAKFKSVEHDFSIFSCNKETGTLHPGSVEFIDWIFRPLEVKEYSVDVPIITDDGQIAIITFVGQGLEEPEHNSQQTPKLIDKIPTVQKLCIQNQIGMLSEEHINFGNVPIGAQLKKIIFIRNISQNSELSFWWKFPRAAWGENPCIKVIPECGKLGPGESRICKLIFTPTMQISIYDLTIECHILNETEKAAFELFQEDVKMKQREGIFSIESRTTTASSKTLLGSAGKTKHSLRGSKFSPLPEILGKSGPALTNSVADLAVAEIGVVPPKVADSERIDMSNAPYEPQNIPLYVSIHAQSYTPDEFRILFNSYDTFYHQKATRYDSVNNLDAAFSNMYQKILHKNVLAQMLDEIIEDVEVQKLIEPEIVEPLQYFAQISTKKRNGILLIEELKNGSEEVRIGILSSNSFQTMIESILEETIFNLIQEANVAEFDITKECLMLLKN
ncbi:hypothetical protein HK100_003162 [Physocladia obscura]|uniref:Uncharacterized protein n=1 Tax=Physocladia obscura TaxID=109957 RepID=A0AAD5SX48_9FUNG|nr:hypothetical protein HK100_003162 [Physocladia obscura]